MDTVSNAPGLPLYDRAALREVEAREAARSGDVFALMARAGQAAWQCLLACWPNARRIVVVCGPGNNGGDGYELARYAHQSGREVRVLHLAGHAPTSALAQRACAAYRESGGRVQSFEGSFGDADVLVDALFGIGLSRTPDAATSALVDAINDSGLPVLSLDVPSGFDADRGSAPGAVVVATHTLQFLAAHCGLYTGSGPRLAGERSIAALGEGLLEGLAPTVVALDATQLRGAWPARPRDAHKGHHGHVLCIGGDLGKGGAIMLSADAALRSGAGLVSVATRAPHVPALLARRPEAMAAGVDAGEQLQPLLAQADVVALGPGLGQGEWGQALYGLALQAALPTVLDADALNLLAKRGDALPPGCVLTPHPGEAARLLDCSVADVQADRYAAAQALAARSGAVVVLKGAGSIVAAPGQRPWVVMAGNPGMAVGGMGDVLTGCIAALLAQGLPATEAACRGALLHAVAGDTAARAGERGLLPSDLLDALREWNNAGEDA